MAIRLIALDLDGTLLTSDKKITAATKDTLKRCIKKGIQVVPATGRMHAGIPEDLKKLGIRYIIAANGAIVEDLHERRILLKCSIFWKDALEILEVFKNLPVIYDAQIGGTGKSETGFLRNLEEYVPDPAICRMIRETREEISNLKAYIEERQSDVDKFNITFKDLKLRQQVRERLAQDERLQITSSLPNNLELNASGATKGQGLMFLAEYLSLKQEETMACGDAGNDESMILAAGTGVVMGNASVYMKNLADFVTDSNDNDGVARAIERFAL